MMHPSHTLSFKQLVTQLSATTYPELPSTSGIYQYPLQLERSPAVILSDRTAFQDLLKQPISLDTLSPDSQSHSFLGVPPQMTLFAKARRRESTSKWWATCALRIMWHSLTSELVYHSSLSIRRERIWIKRFQMGLHWRRRPIWHVKLGRKIWIGSRSEGATEDQKTIFYNGFFHTLQYPYEQDEDGQYYSGYDDKVFCLPNVNRLF